MIYWFLGTLVSIASAALAVWGMARGGRRLLVSCSMGLAAFLMVLGYFDWVRQSAKETPLHTYILLAVLPTAGVTFTVALLSRRKATVATQVISATLVSLALVAISLFSVFYP